MMDRLDQPYAVYGTLRSGFGNDRLWWGLAESDGLDIVKGYRLVTNGGFPYALPSPSDEIVVEIIEPLVNEFAQIETRRRLDVLEGYPSFYDRVLVETEGGRVCWMYTPVSPDQYKSLPAVTNNDWANDVEMFDEMEVSA